MLTRWQVGESLELEVAAPAHGGFCIARVEGRVCFVRHALPGEHVRAVVTEDRGGGYFRADAAEILRASPDRVVAPCPHAGPGRCGGCDWQHASASAQLRIKETVVREQFRRLAATELPEQFVIERLPPGSGTDPLLGWRSRITFAVDQQGRTGLHRFHSHEIEPVASCPLGVPGVGDSAALDRRWPGLVGVQVVRDSAGNHAVLAHRPGTGRQARGRRPPDRVEVVEGPEQLTFDVLRRRLAVSASGFWQVHPHALGTFTTALLDALRPIAGERVLDLYAGAGALTAALATAVGPSGRVIGIEAAPAAVDDAAGNLADQPWAEVRRGRLDDKSAATFLGGDKLSALAPDLVVLDPPRSGAGRGVMEAILGLRPRAVGYVACDPAALARDTAVALAAGWQLRSIRGFDAFPMTHHMECVAVLTPALAPPTRG